MDISRGSPKRMSLFKKFNRKACKWDNSPLGVFLIIDNSNGKFDVSLESVLEWIGEALGEGNERDINESSLTLFKWRLFPPGDTCEIDTSLVDKGLSGDRLRLAVMATVYSFLVYLLRSLYINFYVYYRFRGGIHYWRSVLFMNEAIVLWSSS